MGIPVKLEAFEGPLDLLLHLIEKNKIDIYDIPIVEITEQYMEYIRQMQEENLNIMSEFMVMAATLLDIKCKMLLPKEVTEEGEEKDPREELVQQLLHQFFTGILFFSFFSYFFGKKHFTLDIQKSCCHDHKLTHDIQVFFLHLPDIFHILFCNLHDRDIIYIDLIFFDEMQKQIQRTLKCFQFYRYSHVSSSFFFSLYT